jgi:chromosome condensin MukBEF complex kleisin-like MukF subunit
MLEVKSDINAVLDSLKLNFDPQLELEKRAEERKLAQEATLVQDNNVIGLLSEDLEYREVQEGIEEIRAQFKQLENSS